METKTVGDKKKKLDISKPIDKFIYDWGGGMFKRFGSVEEIDKYLCDMRDAISELIKKERKRAYDKGFDEGFNFELPPIIEALKFRQEQYGWKDNKMADQLGLSKSHYSEILAGKRRLPLEATKKAYKLGVPASILLQD